MFVHSVCLWSKVFVGPTANIPVVSFVVELAVVVSTNRIKSMIYLCRIGLSGT